MSPLLFWLFVAIMLFFGGMVVLNRNPVASALSLVVCFLALASLYVSLDAYFIGVIQILVYAGAVVSIGQDGEVDLGSDLCCSPTRGTGSAGHKKKRKATDERAAEPRRGPPARQRRRAAGPG